MTAPCIEQIHQNSTSRGATLARSGFSPGSSIIEQDRRSLSCRWSAAAVVLSSARGDRVSPTPWPDVTVARRAIGGRSVARVARLPIEPLACQTVPVPVQAVGIDSRTASLTIEALRRGSAIEVTAVYVAVLSSRGGSLSAVQGGPVLPRRSTSYRKDQQYQAKAAAHYRPL
jgi:hypothetical protein